MKFYLLTLCLVWVAFLPVNSPAKQPHHEPIIYHGVYRTHLHLKGLHRFYHEAEVRVHYRVRVRGREATVVIKKVVIHIPGYGRRVIRHIPRMLARVKAHLHRNGHLSYRRLPMLVPDASGRLNWVILNPRRGVIQHVARIHLHTGRVRVLRHRKRGMCSYLSDGAQLVPAFLPPFFAKHQPWDTHVMR